MQPTSTIKFSLDNIKNKDHNGISFSNACYLKVYIDDVDILSDDYFEDTFLYFEELRKSTAKSGDYLLFTSLSGIADDGGWNYVYVEHSGHFVLWKIERDQKLLDYFFLKTDYVQAIEQIGLKIDQIQPPMLIEPSHVIFPE